MRISHFLVSSALFALLFSSVMLALFVFSALFALFVFRASPHFFFKVSEVSDRIMHCLGGDRLSLVASFVAIAFSFTSSTGRWRQLSSPRPVHQVQAAAASQSGRLMLTASRSPVAGNTHRFQPSTAEVNYLPAQYIPASTAITLQDTVRG